MSGYVRACKLLGGGHFDKGKLMLEALAERMAHARRKHPQFAEGLPHAVGVVGAEFWELEQAMEHEGAERAEDEALDVAVTALRLAGREWDCKRKGARQ